MVKGNTRQVIVVRSPDTKLFEQAVFFLKEDALEKHGIGEQELLEQARRLAGESIKRKSRKLRRLPPLFWLGAGAFSVALPWILMLIL